MNTNLTLESLLQLFPLLPPTNSCPTSQASGQLTQATLHELIEKIRNLDINDASLNVDSQWSNHTQHTRQAFSKILPGLCPSKNPQLENKIQSLWVKFDNLIQTLPQLSACLTSMMTLKTQIDNKFTDLVTTLNDINMLLDHENNRIAMIDKRLKNIKPLTINPDQEQGNMMTPFWTPQHASSQSKFSFLETEKINLCQTAFERGSFMEEPPMRVVLELFGMKFMERRDRKPEFVDLAQEDLLLGYKKQLYYVMSRDCFLEKSGLLLERYQDKFVYVLVPSNVWVSLKNAFQQCGEKMLEDLLANLIAKNEVYQADLGDFSTSKVRLVPLKRV